MHLCGLHLRESSSRNFAKDVDGLLTKAIDDNSDSATHLKEIISRLKATPGPMEGLTNLSSSLLALSGKLNSKFGSTEEALAAASLIADATEVIDLFRQPLGVKQHRDLQVMAQVRTETLAALKLQGDLNVLDVMPILLEQDASAACAADAPKSKLVQNDGSIALARAAKRAHICLTKAATLNVDLTSFQTFADEAANAASKHGQQLISGMRLQAQPQLEQMIQCAGGSGKLDGSRWDENIGDEGNQGWDVFAAYYKSNICTREVFDKIYTACQELLKKDDELVAVYAPSVEPWTQMKTTISKAKATETEFNLMEAYLDETSTKAALYQVTKEEVAKNKANEVLPDAFHPMLQARMKNALKMRGNP